MVKIVFAKVKEISWGRVTVVICFCISSHMTERIETVSREYDGIIVFEYLCSKKKAPFEYEMTKSFSNDRSSKRNDFSGKS